MVDSLAKFKPKLQKIVSFLMHNRNLADKEILDNMRVPI